MTASSGARRRGREAALQVLFAADAKGELDLATVTTTFDEVLREFDLPPRARERALELARGVAGNCGAIDARIEQALERAATGDEPGANKGAEAAEVALEMAGLLPAIAARP